MPDASDAPVANAPVFVPEPAPADPPSEFLKELLDLLARWDRPGRLKVDATIARSLVDRPETIDEYGVAWATHAPGPQLKIDMMVTDVARITTDLNRSHFPNRQAPEWRRLLPKPKPRVPGADTDTAD